MRKLLIICGPTATGKTNLALKLAKEFHGELVSADSRQVYRGMNIGTGKDLPKDAPFIIKSSKLLLKGQTYIYGYYVIQGIPVWLLDLASPDQSFSVAHFTNIATNTINAIIKRGKLPIVVGGTGLYISSLLRPPQTIHIPPDTMVRKQLSKKTLEELVATLARLDETRLKIMNPSDKKNPRRLIRAIEISLYRQKQTPPKNNKPQWDSLCIGLKAPREILYSRIDLRVDERVKDGIIAEVNNLLQSGFTFHLPSLKTLGYYEWKSYFEKKKDILETINQWKFDEHQYAKRQLTWFKKDKTVLWFDIIEKDYRQKIKRLVERWYNN